jgi:glycosyltransferase involved in cell wall biosynthesis
MGDGASLDVAGEGPALPALRAQADAVAPGRIKFHGRVPGSEVQQLLRGAAVVAVPSRWYENQPMIVLEAFACGTPVVASDLGGAGELVASGSDGALVAANDSRALVAALEPFLRDPARARTMGRAGRTKVEVEFSPERHLQGLDEVYAEAATATGRRRVGT